MRTSADGVTVIIPTLASSDVLLRCLRALQGQIFADFEIIVVDNSGRGAARALGLPNGVRLIENACNAGFGGAVNQAIHASERPLLAVLNDDAFASSGWLQSLVDAARDFPQAGCFASQVRLLPGPGLDSAGMRICGDGSSKQRGHLQDPDGFAQPATVLLPSGSAALYRRAMLDEIGLFDTDFFLYCEDTDLGLRAVWAGWTCQYVPGAVVEHLYSHSAGRASPLKAYLVERNRLFVVMKNFPLQSLPAVLPVSIARYFWHLADLLGGRGRAAEFRESGSGVLLGWYVLKAHFAALAVLPRLWKKRRAIPRRLTAAAFRQRLREHAIGAREVAAL